MSYNIENIENNIENIENSNKLFILGYVTYDT